MTLFHPYALRSVELRNRLGLAPMTQYCSERQLPTTWHTAHYATRAIGLGLVIVEATAVAEFAAVTPHDLGLWSDEMIGPYADLVQSIEAQGAVAGIQLSHAGRKGSRTRPSDGDRWLPVDAGGWPVYAPSAEAFAPGYPVPEALDESGIREAQDQFRQAAARARRAGFRFLELHAGHGRLLHSFLSPIANHRDDAWGGSFENRCRFLIEVVQSVRHEWPDDLPLGVRLSCVDWVEGGWELEDSVRLAGLLKDHGVDLIDCSSSGIRRPVDIDPKPRYQVPFAREIRERTGIATAAVGLIKDLWEADEVLSSGAADIVLLGRT